MTELNWVVSYICKDCGERADDYPCEHCAVYDEVTGEE